MGEFTEEPIGDPISEPLSKATGCPWIEPAGDAGPVMGDPSSEPLPKATGCALTEPTGPVTQGAHTH